MKRSSQARLSCFSGLLVVALAAFFAFAFVLGVAP